MDSFLVATVLDSWLRVFSGTTAITTEICYTNLNARLKNHCMVMTYRDVESFYETIDNRVNINFSSRYGPFTGRKVKSLTYSNHVSGPVVREKITVYELVKKKRKLLVL